GDTGLPRWYVKIGNEARIEGGPVALEAALRRATARATASVPLRPNRVHPLWRTDHNTNVGINAPEIEYAFHPDADWIELTTVHKGGLFGTDYRSCFRATASKASSAFISTRSSASASAGLPASQRLSASASAAPRTPAWCWASRRRVCASSVRAIPTRASPRWKRNSRSSATISAWARWALSALRW